MSCGGCCGSSAGTGGISVLDADSRTGGSPFSTTETVRRKVYDSSSRGIQLFVAGYGVRTFTTGLHDTLGSAAGADDVRIENLHKVLVLKGAAAQGARQGFLLDVLLPRLLASGNGLADGIVEEFRVFAEPTPEAEFLTGVV